MMNVKTVLIASVAVVALVALGVFISLPSADDTIGSGYLKAIGERIGKLEEAVIEHSAEGNDSAAAISYIEAVASAAKGKLERSTITAQVPDDIKADHEALIKALDEMELACAGLYADYGDGETVDNPYTCYDKFDAVADAWAAIQAKANDKK